MKFLKIVGMVLIILGVIALTVQGISVTTEEHIVDIGPVKARAEIKKRFLLPPIVGVLSLTGGAVLVITGSRRQ